MQQTEILVILGHFLPFQLTDSPENQSLKIEKNTWRYYHFTQVYHKWQSNDVWFLRYQVQLTKFLTILDHFLPLYLPDNPKNPNFEKIKKTLGDIIILHMVYHKWQSYDVWFRYDRQNVLSFWTVSGTFSTLTTPKIKILKKWKQILEILSFFTCVP